jgi:Fe-S-cluster-containing dehydrogenase component
MLSEKLVLRFPPKIVRAPVTYHLVKDHDLMVNILRANISPDEAGHMVVELTGTKEQLRGGHKYLKESGVEVQPLEKDVRWLEERCVHCTACISVCPTAALDVDRETMKVAFESEKCIGCELCIPVCGYKAMEIEF